MTAALLSPLAHGDSVLHRIDPRVRMLCVLATSIGIAVTPRLEPLSVAAVAALCLALLARIPLPLLWRRLWVLNGFMIIVLASLPLSVDGEAVWQYAALTFSREGLEQAARIALTGNILVLLLTALVATMEPVVMAHALLHLRVPEKLVRILMFAIRYIDVLNRSRQRIARSMKARGYIARFDAHSLRSSAHMVGSLVAESMDRAQRIERAMRVRGWNGRFPVLHHFHSAPRDFVFAALFVLGLIGVLWL